MNPSNHNFTFDILPFKIESGVHEINKQHIGKRWLVVWKNNLCVLHRHGLSDIQIVVYILKFTKLRILKHILKLK